MADEEPWFVYRRTPGRITGRPASWKGWAALLGAIAGINLLAVPLMGGLIAAGRPVLGGVALAVVLLTGLFLLFRLMLAKGRRID